jgi:hypothetical protein
MISIYIAVLMKLQLLTLNVQGLNGNGALHLLINYLQPYLGSLDIVCLQKHKLRCVKLRELGSQLWCGATYLVVEASLAYNHAALDDGAGSGGLSLLVAPRLSHLIHSLGMVLQNQAQWMALRGYLGGDLGILNVYAPHILQEHIHLWLTLEAILSPGLRWVITRD